MQIRWSPQAEADAEEALAYIANDNPSAAHKQLELLQKAVESLLHHPGSGRAGRVVGTRELIVYGTPFLIPYRVKMQEQVIEVIRVFHHARQWPQQM